jgi:hypothetical protein
MAEKNTSNGIRLGTLLFLIFLVLKLTDNIDWSWWWVTAPLWIPLVSVITFIGIIGTYFYIIFLLKTKK